MCHFTPHDAILLYFTPLGSNLEHFLTCFGCVFGGSGKAFYWVEESWEGFGRGFWEKFYIIGLGSRCMKKWIQIVNIILVSVAWIRMTYMLLFMLYYKILGHNVTFGNFSNSIIMSAWVICSLFFALSFLSFRRHDIQRSILSQSSFILNLIWVPLLFLLLNGFQTGTNVEVLPIFLLPISFVLFLINYIRGREK